MSARGKTRRPDQAPAETSRSGSVSPPEPPVLEGADPRALPRDPGLFVLTHSRLGQVLALLLLALLVASPASFALQAALAQGPAEALAFSGFWLGDLPRTWAAWALAWLLLLHLAARLTLFRGPGLRSRVLALAGLGATLAGLLQAASLPEPGTLVLRVGEEAETCEARESGRPVRRLLGQRIGLSVWDPLRGTGELSVREAGGQGRAVPLGVGRKVRVAELQVLPVAQAPDPRPRAVLVAHRPRSGGPGGQVLLSPGERVSLGPDDTLAWGETSDDLMGLGPAIEVVHESRELGQDRRWLLLSGAPREEQQRSGPLVLQVTQVRSEHRVWFRVATHRGLGPEWLGLVLLALAAALGLREGCFAQLGSEEAA